MFDQNDFHNPFNNGDMQDKKDAEILSNCCKPLNKCYIKLNDMSLSCDGFGSKPDETENLEYDFNPFELTNQDDIKNKCCKPNCYYSLKKRNLQCKTGIARSQWDGHQPFSDGFAKQKDENVLKECCAENCFSHFADNQLSCDEGNLRDKHDFHSVDFASSSTADVKKECCRHNCFSFFQKKKLTCSAGTVRGQDDGHHADFDNLQSADLQNECCRTKCSDELTSRKMSCDDGSLAKDDERSKKDWKYMSNDEFKRTCCEEAPEHCKTKHTPYGNWEKRVQVLNDVTYLDNWGKSILKTKNNAYASYFMSCKLENKKHSSQQECDSAGKNCCFQCESADCNGNYPSKSTCKDNKSSDFMKKHGSGENCDTSGRMDLGMKNDCRICPQAQDLFKDYDDGALSSALYSKKTSGFYKVRNAFHGGANLHNVLSEVHISDKDCPTATAGLLITPHNSGVFTGTGKSGTLLAVVDVVNKQSSDPSKGVELGGEADYLLVGGSNEGKVDITTSGYVSVVGLDNAGTVTAKGADNLVIGNTINSGKVVLAAKNGKIVNVANLNGAEVVIESGTWQFDGTTRNNGVVRVKGGKFTGNVKENRGKIIIESGVTGKVVFCKNGPGEIKNDGQVEISYESGAAFCTQEVTTPAPKLPPAYFYCRNAAKRAEDAFDKDSTCGKTSEHLKTYWEVVKHELDSPDAKRFFSSCCDPERTPPKGKKYILQQKKIKKKVVKASTTVTIDFTGDKNKDAREKFERVFVRKAKAKSGKFDYKVVQSRGRHLAQGTAVSAILEYDSDTAAEEGQQVVSASTFATQVSDDLKQESVDIALTSTSADIEETTETVVEEVLVDDPEAEDGSKSGDSTQKPPILGDAPYKPMVSFAIVLAAIIALC